MNWHRLRGWLETHDSLEGREATSPEQDPEELAARVARWYSLVLRFGMMTSKYGALAAGSVQTPGRHHLAVMLYGSSLAECNTARASLQASVAVYAGALQAQMVTPEQAVRMTIAITERPGLAATWSAPANDALRLGVRAHMVTWCREVYATTSGRGMLSRIPAARTADSRMEPRGMAQRHYAPEHRESL